MAQVAVWASVPDLNASVSGDVCGRAADLIAASGSPWPASPNSNGFDL
jgi:hypothetical protein